MQRQRFAAINGGQYFMTGVGQRVPEELQGDRIIINNKNTH